MPQKQYPVAVVIGRWQLPHLAHLALIKNALQRAEQVFVVIGSALRSRTPINPFREFERQSMIESMLTEHELAQVTFITIRDYFDNERWGRMVRKEVHCRTDAARGNIALVGFKKDESSQYLGHFPEWSFVDAGTAMDIDATALRDVFFGADCVQSALKVLKTYVHPGVLQYLQAWSGLPFYEQCRQEHRAVTDYRKKYAGPYYLTADSILEVNGHVLLVRRGGQMGNGLLALPGGFLDEGETLYQAAVRELREETGFSILPSSMLSALKGQAVFDHPRRSARGRLITHAYHFQLQRTDLPQVQGADDAQEALWWPISQLSECEPLLFEDHATILDHFVRFRVD
jgi:bifunctional NMN adenylyltransferase/nudix hydrolase